LHHLEPLYPPCSQAYDNGLRSRAGFNVDVDVLNTTVIGTVANASLPSIEVVPPSNGFNVTWSALLMTLEITSANFTPFTDSHQLLLTALTTQVTSVCQEPYDATDVLHDATDVLHVCTAHAGVG